MFTGVGGLVILAFGLAFVVTLYAFLITVALRKFIDLVYRVVFGWS